MIVGVAIYHDGRLYSLPKPNRHNHVIGLICNEGQAGIGNPVGPEGQGFIDDHGDFLDRIEGAEHAIRCGQIKELQWPPRLFSEDLW